MKIDLRADFEKVYGFLESRINNFNLEENSGPQPQSEKVSMVQIGYEFEQTGWIAIVFDMREKAKPDGQWGVYAEDNMLTMDHWFDAINVMYKEESSVEATLPDGSVKLLDYKNEEDFFVFGIMIKEVLVKARESGMFSKLPLADPCLMGVEELTGTYSWPHYENRESEGNVLG